MSTPLLPLLDILRNPDNPSFAEAAQRLPSQLADFNPATFTEAERIAVLAAITVALENISQAQALTGQELGVTQKRAQALQSYGRHK